MIDDPNKDFSDDDIYSIVGIYYTCYAEDDD